VFSLVLFLGEIENNSFEKINFLKFTLFLDKNTFCFLLLLMGLLSFHIYVLSNFSCSFKSIESYLNYNF